MSLMSQIKSVIRPVNNMIFNDAGLVTPIIWSVFVESSFDESKGYNVEVYNDYKIDSAIKLTNQVKVTGNAGIFGQGSRNSAGSGIAKKNINILLESDELPPNYSTKDNVLMDGKSYAVLDVDNVFDIYWIVELTANG